MVSKGLTIEPSNNLTLEIQQISLESDLIGNFVDSVKSILPKTVSLITEFKESLVRQDEEQLSSLLSNKVDLKSKTNDYVKYGQTLLSVPEGFKGNLLDYGVELNKISDRIYNHCYSYLDEFSFILSAFITNKENKISIKKHEVLFDTIEKTRNEIISEYERFLDPNSNNTKQYLKSTLHRFNDIPFISKELQKLNKSNDKKHLESINKSIIKLIDLLNIIIANINDGKIEDLNSSVSYNLSKGSYELAKFIELVSIHKYRVEQYMGIMKSNYELLDSILE